MLHCYQSIAGHLFTGILVRSYFIGELIQTDSRYFGPFCIRLCMASTPMLLRKKTLNRYKHLLINNRIFSETLMILLLS